MHELRRAAWRQGWHAAGGECCCDEGEGGPPPSTWAALMAAHGGTSTLAHGMTLMLEPCWNAHAARSHPIGAPTATLADGSWQAPKVHMGSAGAPTGTIWVEKRDQMMPVAVMAICKGRGGRRNSQHETYAWHGMWDARSEQKKPRMHPQHRTCRCITWRVACHAMCMPCHAMP